MTFEEQSIRVFNSLVDSFLYGKDALAQLKDEIREFAEDIDVLEKGD